MPRYKIWYTVGYGREEEEIEAGSEDEANEAAYEAFSQACEGTYDWGAEELEEGEAEEEESPPCE